MTTYFHSNLTPFLALGFHGGKYKCPSSIKELKMKRDSISPTSQRAHVFIRRNLFWEIGFGVGQAASTVFIRFVPTSSEKCLGGERRR